MMWKSCPSASPLARSASSEGGRGKRTVTGPSPRPPGAVAVAAVAHERHLAALHHLRRGRVRVGQLGRGAGSLVRPGAVVQRHVVRAECCPSPAASASCRPGCSGWARRRHRPPSPPCPAHTRSWAGRRPARHSPRRAPPPPRPGASASRRRLHLRRLHRAKLLERLLGLGQLRRGPLRVQREGEPVIRHPGQRHTLWPGNKRARAKAATVTRPATRTSARRPRG